MAGLPTTIGAEVECMLNEYLDRSYNEQSEPDYVAQVKVYNDGICKAKCFTTLEEAEEYAERVEYSYEYVEIIRR